jgi:tRNA threonylcarbamoyladenosine biosynthesis protein TsaE
MAKETYVSYGDQETKQIAADLINSLSTGTVVCLEGVMAAGKTTFSQGVGVALNIPRVVSPTYMIMREYAIENHKVFKRLFHLDLYRLNTAEEIKAFDLEEIWSQPENLILVEWPEKFFELLPKNRVEVQIKVNSGTEREITINKPH